MFQVKWIVLALAVIMYVFVIIFQDKKVWFTSAAALIIVALGIILPDSVFPLTDAARAAGGFTSRIYALKHSVGEIINWNVIMIYLGSMIIAALFIYVKVYSEEEIANMKTVELADDVKFHMETSLSKAV